MRNENFTCSKRLAWIVVVLLETLILSLDKEGNGTNGSKFCDNDNIFVVCFNSHIHENGIGIKTVLRHGTTSRFIGLTEDDDGLCFTYSSSFKINWAKCWTSNQVYVFKQIDFTPDICITVEIFITKIVVTENNNRPLLTTLKSGPKRKNEVLDTLDNTTYNDVLLDVFIQNSLPRFTQANRFLGTVKVAKMGLDVLVVFTL